MIFSMTIGEKIKQLREEREWSQEQLATMLGYKSRSTINKIELNINELTQSKILAFANVFSVNPCQLLDDEPLNMDEVRARWEENSKQVAEEVSLIELLQAQYGKEAVQMLSAFVQLNNAGKQKALANIQDLLDVPKYRKED